MPTITIDNQEITVQPGATILDAAGRLGIRIPTLCHLKGHPAITSCMVCVVKVAGVSRLLPACATRAQEGMVVESESHEVHAARRMALELLLGDHLGDCVGPCHSTCPAHMNIPLMIDHIAAGRNRDAIRVVKEHIALPAVLGRICPEICEKACRRTNLVGVGFLNPTPTETGAGPGFGNPGPSGGGAVSICLLKRFAADMDLALGSPYVPVCKPFIGKKVAIIGAGPAGLSAAYYLLREGVACVLYDENPLPGGTLRSAIPPQRLPREVIDAEVAVIESMGARFKMAVRIGEQVSLDDLLRDFDAVIVAAGVDSVRLGLKMGAHGVKIHRHILMTHSPGVFAAGSAISPHKHAVRAVAEGRTAALSAAAYLAGKPFHDQTRPYTVKMGKLAEDELAIFARDASASDRIRPAGDGFAPDEAAAESRRCLHCECAKLTGCKLRDYAMEYAADPGEFKGERRHFAREFDHPLLVYEPGKCISCGICVALAEESGEPLGLAFIGRGFSVRVGVPFGESLSEGLRVAAEKCAEACPTGALVLKENRP